MSRPMSRPFRAALAAAVALAAAAPAFAVQETFTDAAPLDCSAVKTCTQLTTDGLFRMRFKPTYPTTGPTAAGYEVREPAVEISAASGGTLDLSIMAVSLSASKAWNGVNFLGAIRLDVQDATTGAWSAASQWSTWIGSPQGIYVVFNGLSPDAPRVQGVRAVRLVGVNGATGFRIGMMNLTAH